MSVTRYLNSFWNAGYWSFVLIGLIAVAFYLGGISFDPFVGGIAGVGVWVTLLVLSRVWLIMSDATAFAAKGLEASSASSGERDGAALADTEFTSVVVGLLDSGVARTGVAIQAEADETFDPATLRIAFEDAEQSIQLWYIPVQALVWALPALGFIGTAWQMRNLLLGVMGLAAQERSLDTQTLSAAVPFISNAMAIICLALGLSVISYLAVSLTFKQDIQSLYLVKSRLSVLLARRRRSSPADREWHPERLLEEP